MALSTSPGKTFKHTQDVPSDTWVIKHSFGSYPVVDVYLTVNGIQQKVIPLGVQYTNASTCTVTFSDEQTGVAIVS